MTYKIRKIRKVHTIKWDRCVKKVNKKGIAVNPVAVCTKRLGKKSYLK